MEISIVTPHAVFNYGAVLQAHALYKYLESSGYHVWMMDFPPHKSGRPKSARELIYTLFSNVFKRIYSKPLLMGDHSFQTFIDQFQLTNRTDLPLYIVGSDQVWNPANLDHYFSLDFVGPKSTKASYAASMGISVLPAHEEQRFRKMLSTIPFLSAREAQTASEISRVSGRECRTDVDPTFLMPLAYWRKQEKKVDIQEPFVLFYLLHIPSNIRSVIKQIRDKYKCNIYIIDRSGFLHLIDRHLKGIYSAGPAEFLWLIDHAKMVVTSSFHGTAFSIIFQKQFISLINPAAPSRISNLLSLTGLTSYGISNDAPIPFEPIGYNEVNDRFNVHINNSKNYLQSVIKGVENEK